MYNFVINIHIVISSLFFLLAFFVVGLSVYKLTANKKFRSVDGLFGKGYLSFLYLQLISGSVLYFFLKPADNPQIITLEQAIEKSELRFWAIEHLAMMIFALTLAQIGYLFISKSNSDKQKHRNTLFFYGFSLAVVTISTSIALVREGVI
ncbi:MAG: hypothetical protein ACOC31_03600 [Bacteroidota bacterium]